MIVPLFVALLLVAAEPAITLRVSPLVQLWHEGATVNAQWEIAPRADNRWYRLEWLSETGVSGATSREVDGEEAATHYERLIEVEIGEYLVRACVYQRSGARFCARQSVEVL